MRQTLTKLTHPDVFTNMTTRQEFPFVEGQDRVLQEWRRRSETCSCPWEWRKWQKRDTVSCCGSGTEPPAPQADISSKAATLQVPLMRLQHETSIIPWMVRRDTQDRKEVLTESGHVHDF